MLMPFSGNKPAAPIVTFDTSCLFSMSVPIPSSMQIKTRPDNAQAVRLFDLADILAEMGFNIAEPDMVLYDAARLLDIQTVIHDLFTDNRYPHQGILRRLIPSSSIQHVTPDKDDSSEAAEYVRRLRKIMNLQITPKEKRELLKAMPKIAGQELGAEATIRFIQKAKSKKRVIFYITDKFTTFQKYGYMRDAKTHFLSFADFIYALENRNLISKLNVKAGAKEILEKLPDLFFQEYGLKRFVPTESWFHDRTAFQDSLRELGSAQSCAQNDIRTADRPASAPRGSSLPPTRGYGSP